MFPKQDSGPSEGAGGVGRGKAAPRRRDLRGLLTSQAASRRAIRRGRRPSQGRGGAPSRPRMPLRGRRPSPEQPEDALPRPPPAPRPRRRPDWLARAKRPLAIGHRSPAWEVSGCRLAVGPLGVKAEGAEAAPDSRPRPPSPLSGGEGPGTRFTC